MIIKFTDSRTEHTRIYDGIRKFVRHESFKAKTNSELKTHFSTEIDLVIQDTCEDFSKERTFIIVSFEHAATGRETSVVTDSPFYLMNEDGKTFEAVYPQL